MTIPIAARTIFVASILITITAWAQPATTEPAAEIRYAKRMVGVRNQLQSNYEDLSVALNNHAAELGAQRAGLKGTNLSDWLWAGNRNSAFELSVHLPDSAPPVAAEIADALVAWVTDYITEEDKAARKQAIELLEKQLAVRQAPAAECDDRLRKLRQELRKLSGRSDISSESLLAALSATEEQRQKMELDLLAKTARREAIEKEIAQASERSEKRVNSDPIAAELQKVVDAREQKVDQLKTLVGNGQASPSDLNEAIATAAEARAKVLQQRRDAAAAAGGNALESLNQELITLSIDSRELEAKLTYLKDKLPRLRESVEMLDQLQVLANESRFLRAQVEEASRQLSRERMQLDQQPPVRILVKESKNARSPNE